MNPRRAILFFFEEGEAISANALCDRLADRQYAILHRPAVMRAPTERHLLGVISMPDDELEADKRKRKEREAGRRP